VLVYLKPNLFIWFVTDFLDVMSNNIRPGTYVWAKFAQTFVKWPGRLGSVDSSTDYLD